MYDRPFRWWVQSVMPLVFDDSLSYYEVLAKLTKYIEGLTGDVEQIEKIIGTIEGIEDITQFTEMLESIKAEIGNLSNLSTQSKTDLVSAINEVALKADIAYWKPPTGIPESDLSQSVQDKLNRTGGVTKYIINNKELKAAPSNNSPADLGLGTYSVPTGGIPWDTLSQDVQDRINAGGSGTGGTTDYTGLNNKPQINGHTLNAGNNTSESLGLGTYSKPSNGIPESDLSAEVQEKLNTSGGIADNQQSFVASRDYEAGELVYINGTLYKTKYKILAGTTMIPGNNIETTDISAELERINSDIDALQSGSGPDSWNLTTVVESDDSTEITNFFEYFNCIGGENYNFILDPVEPTVGYIIGIFKRDGTVVHSFDNTSYPQYTNRQRFTFTPTDTGEYYCTIQRSTASSTVSAHARVIIEYTQSQGISELWSKVSAASQLEPRVSAVETLVGQQQIQLTQLGGIPERVDALENTVDDITEPSRNLWIWGDQSVTGQKIVTNNAALPAGTYTMSALVTKAENGNVRMSFYKNSVSVANRLAQPYIAANSRNAVTFTLAEQADIIQVYSAANASGTIPAVWADIQLESGDTATSYVPGHTAVDYVARNDLAEFEEEVEEILNNSDSAYNVIKSLEGEYASGYEQIIELKLPTNCVHPIVICLDAKYTQNSGVTAFPYIRTIVYTDRNFERGSMRYKVGAKDEYKLICVRGVPYLWDNRSAYLQLKVPTGCTLNIRHAYCYFERSKTQTADGVQFHAHDGSCNVAPPQTLPAFKMAYESGYNSAIVIPKVSSDGVWFAYHDDTFDIDTTLLRNADGTKITDTEYDGSYFSGIPWSYLSQLIYGAYGTTFSDVHIMKLSDFFELCAKTGMSPMFSMHPRYGIQTTEVLTSLKNLVKKYGLLNKLIMKMPLVLDNGAYNLSNFTSIFSVFGNDIARYEVDAVDGMSDPSSVITLFDGVSANVTVPKVIEWWANQIISNENLVASALSAGYEVSCVENRHTDISGDQITALSSETVKKMMDLGVTEFTCQYNTSNGLYW